MTAAFAKQQSSLFDQITALKKERNAVILAHNYQIGDVQDIADYVGDSLGLSQTAAKTQADVIIFCGVHFMAETASILCPTKKVLIPDLEAGCSLADMITAKDLRAWKAEHPGAVVVAYVNTTAEVKAESDYCCTSSNAVKIVESIPADKEILFVPDKYLGNFVREKTGRTIHLWPGYCGVHSQIPPERIEALKQKHPQAEFLIHPECGCSTPHMMKADQMLSTEGMLRRPGVSPAKEFLVATETGILHRMKKEYPEKTFLPVMEGAVCGYMKKITLEKVLWSLQDLQVEVKVPAEIAARARKAIDRMVETVDMSELTITAKEWKKWKGETLAVFAFQEDSPRLLGLGKEAAALSKLAQSDGFKGKEGHALLVRPPTRAPAERLLLIGLGKSADFTSDALRKAAARILRHAEALGLSAIDIRAPHIATASSELSLELQALAEGLRLGHYRFDRHLTPSKESRPLSEIHLWTDSVDTRVQQALDRARLYSRATALARDLINEPPSRMNPEVLASYALKVKAPVSVRVFETKELEKMGMGALLGVGAGGAVPPRLVEMIYKPSGKAKKVVALVGKGITFDSGGLSLKPAASMETMKDDMSGAAAVIGVMSVLAELKIPFEVRGYLAIAENMPGGRAQKPGDVVKAFNGKSIEVLNTDAEGRLVLADALSYASSKKPDVLIDIATLTGACVVALGHLYSAIMTNKPELARALIAAGRETGENFWELPLVKEYQQDVKSKIADLKNIGGRRGEAGTIIGGLFLQEFADAPAWAHLDIAGPSWADSDQPYCPTGGTGHPVRTLLAYLENLNG